MPFVLTDLPNEVLFEVLTHVPPTSVARLQRTSRKFNDLAQPLLWRYYCQTHFKYWSEERHIHQILQEDASKVDWKKIFAQRHVIGRDISRELNGILNSQVGRGEKCERIISVGYDAKDMLLQNLEVGDDAEDVLARRYYSSSILGYLHRTKAIQEWMKLRDGQSVSLERALAAFDMFVFDGRDGDLDDVSARLQVLTDSLLKEIPEIMEQSPKAKALSLVAYMRRKNLTGIKNNDEYHDLHNNFLGIALQDDNHPSLPIISAAMYCAIARRIGIKAFPCCFPLHVVVIVKLGTDEDKPEQDLDDQDKAEIMYLDLFRSDEELLVANLKSQLSAMGVLPSNHSAHLGISSTVDMVYRNARNIINSIQLLTHTDHRRITRGAITVDVDSALYGAIWAMLLLPGSDSLLSAAQHSRSLSLLMVEVEKRLLFDVRLIEEYIFPAFGTERPGYYGQLRDAVRLMRVSDIMPKQVQSRLDKIARNVQYHVGDLFMHKRYGYQGVITGWDKECDASKEWISRMQVDNLPRGRHQSFYQVLADDESIRYVAEENIRLFEGPVHQNLLRLAGRYFKRWDPFKKAFISNLRDQYPDD